MIPLSDILKPANILLPIPASNKIEAITQLVDLLARNGELTDPKRVLESVLDREATRTTGIGKGLAIPHGKSAGVDKLVIAVGRPAEPVDFQSIDGKPVSMIWLLTSPMDKTTPHIHALSRISKLMNIDDFRTALNAAPSASAMYDLIIEQDSKL